MLLLMYLFTFNITLSKNRPRFFEGLDVDIHILVSPLAGYTLVYPSIVVNKEKEKNHEQQETKRSSIRTSRTSRNP